MSEKVSLSTSDHSTDTGFYEIPESISSTIDTKSNAVDWPIKMNNASVCVMCLYSGPGAKSHDQTDMIDHMIRHLPPGKNRKPDISKVCFIFTYANLMYNHPLFTKESSDNFIKIYKQNLNKHLNKNYGVKLPDNNWALFNDGKKDSKPFSGQSTPDQLLDLITRIKTGSDEPS